MKEKKTHIEHLKRSWKIMIDEHQPCLRTMATPSSRAAPETRNIVDGAALPLQRRRRQRRPTRRRLRHVCELKPRSSQIDETSTLFLPNATNSLSSLTKLLCLRPSRIPKLGFSATKNPSSSSSSSRGSTCSLPATSASPLATFPSGSWKRRCEFRTLELSTLRRSPFSPASSNWSSRPAPPWWRPCPSGTRSSGRRTRRCPTRSSATRRSRTRRRFSVRRGSRRAAIPGERGGSDRRRRGIWSSDRRAGSSIRRMRPATCLRANCRRASRSCTCRMSAARWVRVRFWLKLKNWGFWIWEFWVLDLEDFRVREREWGEWRRFLPADSVFFFFFSFYLIYYFNIFNDTWRPVIVHMGATSSLNGRINSLTNGCMRLSQN